MYVVEPFLHWLHETRLYKGGWDWFPLLVIVADLLGVSVLYGYFATHH